MVTIYETNLLEPIWWINSLFGEWTIFLALAELFILSFIRKIPNIQTFSFILISMNVMIMIHAIFSGEGITMGTGLLTLMLVIYAIIFWSSYNDS
jgi:uncharacterized membrane protein